MSSPRAGASRDGDGVEAGGKLPRHVAIIMDGNGRWAAGRRWARIRGHRAGVKSVREITTACAELGIEQLTLYAFSAENWKRPAGEVDALMRLLARFLVSQRKTILKNDIRLATIGRTEALPAAVRQELARTMELSAANPGMVLCLALNYGSRQEIAAAARRLAERARAGELDPAAIGEEVLAAELDTAGMPDPDLLIRTGGEVRLSNYLLWQASYAELWFTPVLWPDFRRPHLEQAIAAYAARERRFGAVGVAT